MESWGLREGVRKVSVDSIRGAKSRMKESPGRVDRSIPAAVQGLPRSCHLLSRRAPPAVGGMRAAPEPGKPYATPTSTPPGRPRPLQPCRPERCAAGAEGERAVAPSVRPTLPAWPRVPSVLQPPTRAVPGCTEPGEPREARKREDRGGNPMARPASRTLRGGLLRHGVPGSPRVPAIRMAHAVAGAGPGSGGQRSHH